MKQSIIVFVLLLSVLCCFSFPVFASDAAGLVDIESIEPEASISTLPYVVDESSDEILDQLELLVELQAVIAGILVFITVVLLFYLGYKFFRMFF